MSDNAEVAVLETQSTDSVSGGVAHKPLKHRSSVSIQSQGEAGGTTRKTERPPERRVRAGQDIGTSARRPAAGEPSEPPSQEEQRQMRDVASLWSSQRTSTAAVRKSREELAQIRMDLSKSLYELKSLLAQNGRGGKWAPYLRSMGISLSTADRYVQKWAVSVAPPEKLLSEEVSPSTPDTIQKLVAKLRPKLIRVLTSQEAIAEFMAALAVSLQW